MDNRFQKLFIKFFSTEISDEDWKTILEEWDTSDKISWVKSVDYLDGGHLLNEWCKKSIPPFVIEYLTEKHGKDIWGVKDEKGENPISLLLNPGRTIYSYKKDIYNMVEALVKNANIEDIEKVSQDLLVSEKMTHKDIFGYDQAFWSESKLAPIVFLLHQNHHSSVKEILKQKPHLFNEKHYGLNVASLMSTTEKGWNNYIEAGGSMFAPVFVDPLKGNETTVSTPLWLWLLQKKIYHDGIAKTLENIMVRLSEDRGPQEDEIALSDEEWKLVEANKTRILSQMKMIEFEKLIQKDWKKAIKENKNWRKWKSSEGANFMHWLAVKRITDFTRQAHKVKLNAKLIRESDNNGNDIFAYMALGALTGDMGSYRRKEKLLQDHWPLMIKNIDEIINKNPKRGFIAQMAMTEPTSFFGAPKLLSRLNTNHSYEFGHLYSYITKYPGLLLNGYDEEASNKTFQSIENVEKIAPLLSNAWTYIATNKSFEEIFDDMPINSKIAYFVAVATPGLLYNMQDDNKVKFQQKLSDAILEEHTLSLTTLEVMQNWMDKNAKGYYGRSWNDTVEKLSSWLSSQVINLSIEKQNQNKAEEEQPKATKKRKM